MAGIPAPCRAPASVMSRLKRSTEVPSAWSRRATSSRSTSRSGGWLSSASRARAVRKKRSKLCSRADGGSGTRRGRVTTPASSPCTRKSPGTLRPARRLLKNGNGSGCAEGGCWMADSNGRKTVVIADYDYGDVDIEREIIEKSGLRLVAAQCKTEDDVIAAARDADAIIAQYATVGARAISALTRCEVIARYGTGTDIVDVDAATQHGILVTNVPNDWCENEVADHAMALLLAAARKIIRYDQATRAGIWRWQTGEPIHRLSGHTLGLLSFGAIAQAIGRRAAGFGLRVIAR